jgi:large subunit ribosomal protein L3
VLVFKGFDEGLTKENQAFVKEMVYARYGPPAVIHGVETFAQPKSVLAQEPVVSGQWSPGVRRSGLIARKIGIYPMWLKNGTKVATTLLHVRSIAIIDCCTPACRQQSKFSTIQIMNIT